MELKTAYLTTENGSRTLKHEYKNIKISNLIKVIYSYRNTDMRYIVFDHHERELLWGYQNCFRISASTEIGKQLKRYLSNNLACSRQLIIKETECIIKTTRRP